MKEVVERIPPQSIEAEIAVLGSILLDKSLVDIAGEKLKPEHFYRKEHQTIFKSILELYNEDKPVDLITLAEWLKKKDELENVGGASYLSTLVSAIPTPANIEHYASIVREKAILRDLINVSTEIINRCYTGEEDGSKLLDRAEQMIFDIAQQKRVSDFVSIKELISDSIELAEKLAKKKEYITGLPTGFKEIDIQTSGLHPSELIIVAGRPSMGKTSFVLNITRNVGVEEKKPVAFFSLEMSKEQVVQRLLCMEARVDSNKLRTGFLREEDWPKLTMGAGILFEAPIFIDDSSGLNSLQLRAKARRLKAKEDIALIVVDYIQLMTSAYSSENRQQEIAEISRSLKSIARELKIPVIGVSQLSRRAEERDRHRPRLSDLRESGALEQDADVVMLLLRDEYYNPDNEEVRGKAEINIAKQRNGPVGSKELVFLKEYTRFEDLSYIEEE
ncbi:MAG TPA: replicative DNA helicase [Candidatus Omnitrophica bacterium]|nr:replicative DNA helicase [Candidatus Omnitrophota bacterium]